MAGEITLAELVVTKRTLEFFREDAIQEGDDKQAKAYKRVLADIQDEIDAAVLEATD